MDYGIQGSIDTSSEENDQQEEVKDYNSARRSYECTFCKRGFTNAQALGGHMNIHRKDRAKAKQLSGNTSVLSINKPDDHDQYMSSGYFGPISNMEPTKFYPVLEPQRNCHMYYQPSASGQGQYTHGWHENLLMQRLVSNDLLGSNLSLTVGSTNVEDGARMNDDKEELDLELRLGHYPYQ